MKKKDIILIITLVVVIVLGVFVMKGEKQELLKLEGEGGLTLLSYDEYQEKIDKGDNFVVIISRESCSHCANFIPVAEEFASDESLPMYYIDTDTFSESDWVTFQESNTFFQQKSNWGTPTTLVQSGMKTLSYIEGETTKEKLKDLYERYFKLKEE